jgi:hypothetical protein
MIKYFIVLFFTLLFNSVMAQTPNIKDVRLLLHQATSSEETCNKLISILNPYDEANNPLLFGYRGGATMIMAKHAFNPFSKLSHFKKGKNFLEKAIKADIGNVELRFLRYTIQTSVPSFLNYSAEKQSDKQFLSTSLPNIKDQELKKIINAYLLKHP